jgi:N-acetylglucosamine-6-phosphate deacetylase
MVTFVARQSPNMQEQYRIHNGKLILPDGIVEHGTVLVNQGKIIAVEKFDVDYPDSINIDAKGQFISPGFIDIHVHGGGGHDFMDGTEEAFLAIAALHAAHGTTSMMPTTTTAEKEGILQVLDVYEKAKEKNTEGSSFVGLHLEGPYFAMNQRGAQDPKYIRDPDPAEYMEILAYSKSIKRWSVAPERKGAIAFGKILHERGIIASMAHTEAVYEEALEAFNNGYSLLTHFYSAMSGVVRRNARRYAGVVEAGYLHDGLDVEIIADGVHLPAPLLKLVYKIKGPDHTALITDSMRAAGMPEGEYILGNINTGLKVITEEGVAKLPDRSAFAGSIATTDRLVRTMIDLAEIPLFDAVKMMTSTPARIINMNDRIGAIKVGMDADLLVFDEKINVQMTMIKGKLVHQSGTV